MSRDFRVILLITLLHIPLGVLIYNAGSLALLHPAAVFLVGLYWAMQKRFKLERVALAIGYLVGAEVLWRMAQVPLYWEFGKYGSAAIAIVALMRRNCYNIPKLPLIYFAMLLPACVLTFIEFDLSKARSNISFNLSGPFFLLVSCWLFSNIKISPLQLRRLLFAIILPLFSVAFATLFITLSTIDIQFTTESNFETSGGFGPNQVSSMLGLGAFIAMFSVIFFRNTSRYKIYYLLAAVLFSAQSIMTFSRGGLYNTIGALFAVSVLELRNPTKAAKRLAPIAAIIILFLVVVFPILNNFTGGSLKARFEETGTTRRTEIVESDLEMFFENPVLGVGVGSAYGYREKFLQYKAVSHTEFSRLLAEHGSFGIVALLALIAMTIINVRRQRSAFGRALILGFSVWAVLFMFNAGMRLAAPSFLMGLMFITIVRPFPRRNVRGKDAPPKNPLLGS